MEIILSKNRTPSLTKRSYVARNFAHHWTSIVCWRLPANSNERQMHFSSGRSDAFRLHRASVQHCTMRFIVAAYITASIIYFDPLAHTVKRISADKRLVQRYHIEQLSHAILQKIRTNSNRKVLLLRETYICFRINL